LNPVQKVDLRYEKANDLPGIVGPVALSLLPFLLIAGFIILIRVWRPR
jgi:hypothetical protein